MILGCRDICQINTAPFFFETPSIFFFFFNGKLLKMRKFIPIFSTLRFGDHYFGEYSQKGNKQTQYFCLRGAITKKKRENFGKIPN